MGLCLGEQQIREGTIIIRGGWILLEMGKMGEINKWPQGMVEKQPVLRLKK